MQTTFFDWIILPPGKTAILRFPFKGELSECELPHGLSNPRLATPSELIVANQGRPFPWGYAPEATPDQTSKLWKEKMIGIGGLIHTEWFVAEGGRRYGGASNVPKTGPGALRHYMFLDGGFEPSRVLAANEGLAIVAELSESYSDYHEIQLHAAEHVVKDTGAIIVFPKDENGVYHVGFVGRCMTCPKAELVSLRAVKTACPNLKIEMHPDWKNWKIE
ncbi:MAG: hypothetical protein JWP09_329 [Candidatus Taylorbacteria bacterium]|nr:hypothetical protein [Candidatus Taylorbacteria bacterium]